MTTLLALSLAAGCSSQPNQQAGAIQAAAPDAHAPPTAGAMGSSGAGAARAAGRAAPEAASGGRTTGTAQDASPTSGSHSAPALAGSHATTAGSGMIVTAGHAAPAAGAGAGGPAPAGSSAGAGSGSAATAGAVGAAGAGAPITPDMKYLVAATGPCPEFRDGYVTFTPDGVSRRVLLYMSDAAMSSDGPLIFSWHSTLPNPEDTTSWLGRSVIEEIKQLGGIVAAPTTGYPRETRPWDNTPMGATNTDGDQRLMDEIVACAQAKVGIDLRHIHAVGMSAGGLKTAQVSLRRAGYLASVVVYSGGLTEADTPPDQAPENKLAAMILYGGRTDISPVDGIVYTDASQRYLELMRSRGSFAFLCNHGGGHSVPQDSQASAWRFMREHPFGTQPSPYANALPSGFLRYCSLD